MVESYIYFKFQFVSSLAGADLLGTIFIGELTKGICPSKRTTVILNKLMI